MNDFEFLTYEEEKKLTLEEKKAYYESLKEYITQKIPNLYSRTGIKFRENYIKFVKKILPKIMPYKFIIDGFENIPDEPVIFASTHQDFNDIINSIYSCPEQMIVYNAINIKPFLKIFLNLNGVLYVDRNDKNSRLHTKLQLAKELLNGKSVNIYPEATWNCTPSKLHLPLYKGIVDIAKITGAKIIPIVQEYTYDETKLDGKSHIISVHIRFGRPVSVSYIDDSLEKVDEVSEVISTIRWNLIDEKGTFSRNDISNQLYVDYIRARINDWRVPGNDINEERQQVLGYGSDFSVFNHINDVSFDENGEFFPTDEVIKLKSLDWKRFK